MLAAKIQNILPELNGANMSCSHDMIAPDMILLLCQPLTERQKSRGTSVGPISSPQAHL